MAKQFSKSREYERLGARMMKPIYELFQRPLSLALAREATTASGLPNSRLLDEDHRFIGRDLQRAGLDYPLYVGAGEGSPYRLTDEKADTYYDTGNFAFEELELSAEGLKVKWLHNSRAGFITYIFPMSRDIYFIPLEPVRAFIEANRHKYATASVPNKTYITFCTLVPIADVLAAIPTIRHVHADWFDEKAVYDWHGRVKHAKSELPEEFHSRSLTLDQVKAYVTDMLPEKRKGGLPNMPIEDLLRFMALRDKLRAKQAAFYVEHGLPSLVQDVLMPERFGFRPFTPEEVQGVDALVNAPKRDRRRKAKPKK